MISRSLQCAGAALTMLILVAPAWGKGIRDNSKTTPLERGREVYIKNCAVCHGRNGKGNGPAAYLLFPKPRDFTRGIYKIRSTPTIPTDADLFRTITRGIPGTAMPGWLKLSASDRRALVMYIKSLSSAFKDSATAIAVSNPPPFTKKMIKAGRQLYFDAGCDSCHGPKGKGKGSSAGKLVDEWGYPIGPQDLTLSDRFKGGFSPQDIYRTISVGIGGTPMPTFGDALTEEQYWELVAYVRSLTQPTVKKGPLKKAVIIRARESREPVDPQDPFSPVWNRAVPADVRLMTLWDRKKTIRDLRVRALYTDTELALLIEWDDPTANLTATRPQEFPDAVAVELPLGKEAPSFTMGERGTGVNIWYWRADAELRAPGATLARAYPNRAVDRYPFDTDPTYQTGRAVGNGLFAASAHSSISEMNAEGFGTLTAQPSDDQGIRGHGVWHEGQWRVIMVRSLRTGSPRDRQITAGETVPVAFAVWDGSQGDRNGQKAVSVWQQMRIDTSP